MGSSFCSAWFIIISLMSVLMNASSATLLPAETKVLLALKAGLEDSSGRLQDWLESKNGSPCSWSGVSCNPDFTKVVALNLSRKNLTGTISDRIQELKDLLDLNFSKNLFDGLLSAAIFNLSKLRTLDISHNNFDGSFPPGIRNLQSLVKFNAFSNSFTGSLPVEFVELPLLEELNFAGSYFEGPIPAEYGSFSSNLRFLHLAGNSITGPIPPELGKLQSLRHMEIGYNSYSGGIPPELGNMTELEYLDIAGANLSGELPPELSKLGKLNSMFIFRNNLSGIIPPEMGNLTNIQSLDLSDNQLSGPIPESFTKLKKLSLLSLMYNSMNGTVPAGIAELPNLETLLIWNNFFSGRLPPRLGRNSNLQWLDVSTNDFTGPVPPDLCARGKLFKLILFSNKFDGELPAGLAVCQSLWRFRIQDNMLTGWIPSGFATLPNLTFMDLSINKFTGGFPAALAAGPTLRYLNVSRNSLGGSLPAKIWSSPALEMFSAAFANLSGNLPIFAGCDSLTDLELEGNYFSGGIPRDISRCRNLKALDLSRNELTGLIPAHLAAIPALNRIDLSHNALAGTIPAEFNNCSSLESFNVSFNDLSGPVPSKGIFRHISASVFKGNQFLCGGVMKPCLNLNYYNSSDASGEMRTRTKPGPLVWVMGAGFAISLFIVIVGGHCFYKRYKSQIWGPTKYSTEGGADEHYREDGPWKMTSFGRLSFTVDDVLKAAKGSNIIGTGPSSSTVYKAQMPGGDVIAVKKLQFLNSKIKQTPLEELQVLGNLRHKNILRLLGYCYNNEITTLILVYQFMPNGSLLDQNNKKQDFGWNTRYQIAQGMAQGLCYLHHRCSPVVVHRGLKPSNVLLDSNMEVRLADFGFAKLIQREDSIICRDAYTAPEYTSTLQFDEKFDVYSFGVILLELLTGKSSLDSNGVAIADWVRSKCTETQSTEGSVMKILDKTLASVREDQAMLALHVALLCTNKCPSDRPSMKDVVSILCDRKPARQTVMDFHCSSEGSTSASQAVV